MGEQALSRLNIESLSRAQVVRVFRERAVDVSITSGAGSTVVVGFAIPKNHRGYITAIGHQTTRAGWDAISWTVQSKGSLGVALTARGQAIQGLTLQQGLQWGTMALPREVFGDLPEGRVQLVATQGSGATILASGILVGYHWPVDEPGATR